ncbi:MAG: exopolysaccharide biosynthesis protein [Parvibaculum sp.]
MKPKRRSGAIRGLAKVGTRRRPHENTVGDILNSLGDRGFGWGLILAGLPNMLPLPPGSDLVLGWPAVFVAGQMAWGRKDLWLPNFIRSLAIRRAHWRGAALRALPIAKPLSRITHKRMTWMFEGSAERLLGIFFVIVALNLVLPIPMTGWVSAIALFVLGIGLVEHDGLIVLLGAAIGVSALLLSLGIVLAVTFGFSQGVDLLTD